MLYADGLLLFAELALVVYCVLNVATTPPEDVRNLPKLVWLFLVLLFQLIGCIAWLVAGRPQGPATSSLPYKGNRGYGSGPGAGRIPSEYDRPGRATAFSPDDDEAFLRGLRERAEAQRKQAEIERKRREQTDQG